MHKQQNEKNMKTGTKNNLLEYIMNQAGENHIVICWEKSLKVSIRVFIQLLTLKHTINVYIYSIIQSS